MNNLPSFRHILVIEDQKVRRIVALEEAIYSLGRESSNDIIIYDSVVSRHHATLARIKQTPQGENYIYRLIDGDLQGNRSTNGLMINGQNAEVHDLQHGDVILFGSQTKVSYYILSTALEIALFNCPESPQVDNTPITANAVSKENPNSTFVTHPDFQEPIQEDLVRLASFPQLSPNPIIEMDFTGKITYINPAASIKFKTLHQNKAEHPVLKGVLTQSPNLQGNLRLREIEVEGEFYEQYIHYLTEHRLIRSYLFDITERKQAEKDLHYRAFHDLLTGLPNRNWFNEQLVNALANARRYDHLMAVMFLDLDNFKNVNDTLGHGFGDQLLESFAQRLNALIRKGETLSRWGGDEFIILLPQIKSAEDSINLAQRIINELKQPFEINGHQLYIKTSIGIAIYPQDGEDGETLVKNADAALFRAKERGRNHYRLYSSTMTSKASLLLKLENLLYQALEENEFALHYQPQVKLNNGKISGMEALLRWYHPELGQVSPVKLMPLAEKTDLIIPMSQWILRTACQQSKNWENQGLGAISVAVNFSSRQFQNTNIVAMVGQVLEDTGLAPHLLELEFTETTLMQNIDFSRQTLPDLRNLGVHLSLDNFGTGYSSLSYLQKFPFDTLKIDHSLINALEEKPEDTAIISAMIALGESFNLRVIAQGVETSHQVELLKKLHCEEIQGYWFSYPLKEEDATQFLTQISLR